MQKKLWISPLRGGDGSGGRLQTGSRNHEVSLVNQLELLLMHKETYAIKKPQDLLNFFMRADALGPQKYLSIINLL